MASQKREQSRWSRVRRAIVSQKGLLRLIAAAQVVGLAGAIWLSASALWNSPSTLIALILFPVMLVYALGAVGALLLWRNLRLGIWISIAHQVLLAPLVSIRDTFEYALRGIAHLDIGYSFVSENGSDSATEVFRFFFKMGASLLDITLNIGRSADVDQFGINLVPIALIVILLRLARRTDRLVREPARSEQVFA